MITLICGRIGCGKTTYAQTLPGEKLSIDKVMLERYPPYLGDDFERISNMVRDELMKAAANIDGDVVLDWGFHHRADRDDAKRYFRERGKDVRLLWIDIPEAELQRRRDWRNAHLPPDCYYIDENLARKCDSRFEPPTPDEDYIKITDQE